MEKRFTYQDYARFAQLGSAELARQCELEAFRATGPGGQGVNTTDSAVRMRHVPTGITVVSRESRSQLQNRERCLEKIHAELLRRSRWPKKRHATKPTRASVSLSVEEKGMRVALKRLRRRPVMDE